MRQEFCIRNSLRECPPGKSYKGAKEVGGEGGRQGQGLGEVSLWPAPSTADSGKKIPEFLPLRPGDLAFVPARC